MAGVAEPRMTATVPALGFNGWEIIGPGLSLCFHSLLLLASRIRFSGFGQQSVLSKIQPSLSATLVLS